jgi:hypothetical protein
LAGEKVSVAPPVFYWKTESAQGLLEGDLKLIVPGSKGSPAELYDLAADPAEQKNLATQYFGRADFAPRLIRRRYGQCLENRRRAGGWIGAYPHSSLSMRQRASVAGDGPRSLVLTLPLDLGQRRDDG